MRDSNIPKFLEDDLPLFQGIIKDLFPSVDVPVRDYGNLQRAIEDQLEKQNYQKPPAFITKIIQLMETIIVRRTFILINKRRCDGGRMDWNGKIYRYKHSREGDGAIIQGEIRGLLPQARHPLQIEPQSRHHVGAFRVYQRAHKRMDRRNRRQNNQRRGARLQRHEEMDRFRWTCRRALDREHEHSARRQQNALFVERAKN